MLVERVTGWLKEGVWFLFNLHSEEGDVLPEDWMGVPVFSSGLGVQGNREMMGVCGEGCGCWRMMPQWRRSVRWRRSFIGYWRRSKPRNNLKKGICLGVLHKGLVGQTIHRGHNEQLVT
jgi:hypothetical protein